MPAGRSSESLPRFYNDLEGSLGEAWRLLFRAAADRRAPAHTPQLATVGADGAPEVRTVVLRACDPSRRLLRIHTDRRSGKAAELAANPVAAICAYDPGQKVQVRLRCTMETVLAGPVWEEAWAATRPLSRECYRVVNPSAAILPDPAEAVFDAALTNDGADHFAVLLAAVTSVEWLYLAIAGHRRARFDWDGHRWQGAWLVP